MNLDTELLRILACPKCRGELQKRPEQGEPLGLLCPACSVVYPVEAGIPVLLMEEAVPLEQWNLGEQP